MGTVPCTHGSPLHRHLWVMVSQTSLTPGRVPGHTAHRRRMEVPSDHHRPSLEYPTSWRSVESFGSSSGASSLEKQSRSHQKTKAERGPHAGTWQGLVKSCRLTCAWREVWKRLWPSCFKGDKADKSLGDKETVQADKQLPRGASSVGPEVKA